MDDRDDQRARSSRGRWLWALVGGLALAAGLGWLLLARWAGTCVDCGVPAVRNATVLQPQTVASMESPVFAYSPGWRVGAAGADPAEPTDPLVMPAGVITFAYTGQDLALLVAPGNYWGYLYVTVDGKPANQLAAIAGNVDSTGTPAGYMTLLAPERVGDGNGERWIRVHSDADGSDAHAVRVEVWRGWGQTPIRGVAVDLAGTQAVPWWPGVLLVVVGGWALVAATAGGATAGGATAVNRRAQTQSPVNGAGLPSFSRGISDRVYYGWVALALGIVGLVAVVVGTGLQLWPVCLGGVGLLALAGVARPAVWLAALLFGLPFYFGVKLPLLPNRALDLIDIGVLGGVVIVVAHWGWLRLGVGPKDGGPKDGGRQEVAHGWAWPLVLLGLLVSWALVATVDARYPALAWREWRTVFLNGLLFGVALTVTLRVAARPPAERWLLVAGWVAGAAVVAGAGLWGYAAHNGLVSQAEGVRRIQAFYGSGNNLALYLDRTTAVSLALALFAHTWRMRVAWGLLAAVQLLALLLTFSKGSIFLALPVTLITLGVGGAWLLRREGRSLRPIVMLGGVALVGVLVILPFVGAERFQRLFDVSQGTGFLRVQLWRSAWQMAVDHPLLGVGPDQFLYYYRSGYLLPTAWQEPNLNHPHNLLLDWWTRLGLVGLGLGVAWLGTGTWAVVRWLRKGEPKALALGVLAAVAAGLAHGLIDVSYAVPDLMIVWVLLFTLGLNAQVPRG